VLSDIDAIGILRGGLKYYSKLNTKQFKEIISKLYYREVIASSDREIILKVALHRSRQYEILFRCYSS